MRIEGKYVVREGDACTMNGGNNEGIFVTTIAPSGAPPRTAIETSNPPVPARVPSLTKASSNDATSSLLDELKPKSLQEAVLAAIRRDGLNGQFHGPLPPPTLLERKQIAAALPKATLPSAVAFDGDSRSAAQRFVDENNALYNSPAGAGMYGVIRLAGGSDQTARIFGATVNSIGLVGGAATGQPFLRSSSWAPPAINNGVRITPRTPTRFPYPVLPPLPSKIGLISAPIKSLPVPSVKFNAIENLKNTLVSKAALEKLGKLRTKVYQDWKSSNGSKYKNPDAQLDAYKRLLIDQSPWPENFTPSEIILPTGTRFRMAISPGQPTHAPGGFSTPDLIPNKDYVRNELAVKSAWKKEISGIVEYEVIKPLPVKIGPVGPQADLRENIYLPGQGYQINLNVPAKDRISYAKVVKFTPF